MTLALFLQVSQSHFDICRLLWAVFCMVFSVSQDQDSRKHKHAHPTTVEETSAVKLPSHKLNCHLHHQALSQDVSWADFGADVLDSSSYQSELYVSSSTSKLPQV